MAFLRFNLGTGIRTLSSVVTVSLEMMSGITVEVEGPGSADMFPSRSVLAGAGPAALGTVPMAINLIPAMKPWVALASLLYSQLPYMGQDEIRGLLFTSSHLISILGGHGNISLDQWDQPPEDGQLVCIVMEPVFHWVQITLQVDEEPPHRGPHIAPPTINLQML